MSASALPAAAPAVRRPRRSLRFTRDEELVRLVRVGDPSAFEAIYDRHHRGILSFCRHMLGSREEAEDAVQHTFLSAHRDLVGSDKPIQLKAWLYTIARNRCLSVLRARREERALDEVQEPSVEGLAAQVQRRQDLRDMVADLHRLPDDQREALVLSEIGALSHEEIAVTLDVRKDKVKALVFQAREALASSREARDADCQAIQEQIAVLRGGALRRTPLRRHLEVCPACAAFKAEVQRQRSAMAVILPVVPTVALKETILGTAFAAGGAAAAGGGGAAGAGLLAAAGSKGLAAKVLTIAVVAGGATGGGLVAVDDASRPGDADGTAIAAVPDERESVRMVGALRERARRTADQRRADRGAAAAAPAAPAAAADEDDDDEARPQRRARRRAAGRRPRATAKGERRRPRAVRTPAPAAQPAQPAQPGVAPAVPAVPPAPSGGDDDDEDRSGPNRGSDGEDRSGSDSGKGNRGSSRGRRNGPPADVPRGNGNGFGVPEPGSVPAQPGVPADPQHRSGHPGKGKGRDGQREHDDDRDDDRGRERDDYAAQASAAAASFGLHLP